MKHRKHRKHRKRKIQKRRRKRKSNTKKARTMVGPEYPGEGAAKKLEAGSYSRYPEGVIASAH
jgi:hypothetical protein